MRRPVESLANGIDRSGQPIQGYYDNVTPARSLLTFIKIA